MKKILLSALLLAGAGTASADLTNSGYYRAQNAESQRYAYLLDDKGSYNTHTSSADVQALELYSGFLRASSDPSTVFYFDIISSDANRGISTVNISGQGTSIHEFLDAYLKIWKQKVYNGKQSYLLYAEKSGMVKYLGDIRHTDVEKGYASADAKDNDRLWWFDPISASSSDSYFGIAPTLTAGNKYYHPFYADFDFNAYSSGMKFWTISKVENGVAVIKELSGVVPTGTPVIIECSNPLATDNRLNIGPSGTKADVSGNKLGGVYFNNDGNIHNNQTKYDKNTMRVLAVKNGKLTFETSSTLDFLPRNQAYLKVASGTPADVQVMTEAEYAEYLKQLEYEKNLISAITISPASASLEKGSSTTLTAATTPAKPSNPALTWTSSNPAIATVDAVGVVTAVAAGTTTITVASDNGVKATASITVTVAPASISLDKTSLSLEKGSSETLTATVGPADCTDKTVVWSSDKPAVATVDATGKVTAVGAGSAVITAKTTNGKTATANVTVSVSPAAISLDKASMTLEKGSSFNLTATVSPADCTDKTVTWSSDKPAVASVDATGKVTAVAAGAAVITATTSNGKSASANILVIVSPASIALDQSFVTLEKGSSVAVTATVGPDDCTDKTVTWSSERNSIATVDADGNITAVGAGQTVVTATTANGLTATVSVTVMVSPSVITLDTTAFSLEKGDFLTLVATVGPVDCTDKSVKWYSDNEEVAVVDADGTVTAVENGSAVITAETSNGVKAYASVTVTESPVTISLDETTFTLERGDSYTLTATVGPETSTDKSVTWTSDDPEVAVVDEDGTVTAVGIGYAVITASTFNGMTASAIVYVVVSPSGVELNTTAVDVIEDSRYQLVATVLPEDCTDKEVTWSSSDETVATVDFNGLVTVHRQGTAVITVETVNGLIAECTLTALSGVDQVLASPDAEIYDLHGRRVSSMQRGQIYIIRLNGSSLKVTN